MSNITLSANAGGTGIFTIASPSSNTNRTLTLPDAAGTIQVSGAAAEVPSGSASTPSIYPTGDTNTGIFFPGADRIGFAEGGTQVGEFDASGNFQFNSGYGSVATAYGCRAWVNFNGTGTVAIRASGNVSSITDDGTGIYTVNFTTAMPNTNYAVVGAAGESDSGGGNRMLGLRVLATSSVGVRGFSSASSAVDLPEMCVAIFR
jgi:hypothetical protein